MTDLTANLLAASYPAVLIQRWTASDGWGECYRVFLALPGHLVPIGFEYATYAEAHQEAVLAAECQRGGPCPIIDQTREDA